MARVRQLLKPKSLQQEYLFEQPDVTQVLDLMELRTQERIGRTNWRKAISNYLL